MQPNPQVQPLGAAGLAVQLDQTSAAINVPTTWLSDFDATAGRDFELVLLDIRLPDIDGFEVARRLCAEPRAPVVVLISTRDADDYGQRISRSSALGFLPKDELSAEALGRLLGTSDGRNPSTEDPAGE